MKKIIAFLSILLLVFTWGCTNEQPIGGDTDEQGCLVAAGYSYDEDIKACTRNWELDENQAKAAKIAVEYLEPMKGATINSVVSARCPGCFLVKVKLGLNAGDKEVQVTIVDWQVLESVDCKNGECAEADIPVTEPDVPATCTMDCNKVCDLELECCYEGCVSSVCSEGGKDVAYYEEQGLLQATQDMIGWSACTEPLP
ncbi:MAG: hypothetical protein GY861_09215 [bacterium]|nr:hypothetical protein [bacterium]